MFNKTGSKVVCFEADLERRSESVARCVSVGYAKRASLMTSRSRSGNSSSGVCAEMSYACSRAFARNITIQ